MRPGNNPEGRPGRPEGRAGQEEATTVSRTGEEETARTAPSVSNRDDPLLLALGRPVVIETCNHDLPTLAMHVGLLEPEEVTLASPVKRAVANKRRQMSLSG
jgi:hypothetical protein